ncbi:hypothetical protein ES702_04027 [subsurface metagenome]
MELSPEEKAQKQLQAKRIKKGCLGCLGVIVAIYVIFYILIGGLFKSGEKADKKKEERIYGVHGEVKQIGTIMLQAGVNPQMTDSQFKEAAEKLAQKHGLEEYAKIDMRSAWDGKRARMYEVKDGVATRVYHW